MSLQVSTHSLQMNWELGSPIRILALRFDLPHQEQQTELLPFRYLNILSITFFENMGAISIKTSIVSGRTVKTPVVEYGHIEFDLNAA